MWNGVRKDYTKAFKWYKKASCCGYIISIYNVVVLYENGFGVEKDMYKAFNYYKKADEIFS